MKKLLAILLSTLFLYQLSQAQVVLQSYPFQHYSDNTEDIKTDKDNNILLAGSFLNSATGVISILNKSQPDGTLLWSVDLPLGSSFYWSANGYSIATDTVGNVYLLGNFTDTLQLPGGPTLVSSTYTSDIFLAKYNSAGVLQWARSFGGLHDDKAGDLGCDGAGNVYFTGYNYDQPVISFGNNISFSSRGYLVKLSASGTTSWAIPLSGEGNGLVVNANGEVGIIGDYFSATGLTIGGISYPGSTGGMYVAKIDSMGVPMWAVTGSSQPGNTFFSQGTDLVMDSSGDYYAIGAYVGELTLAGTIFPWVWGYNGYVMKFSSSGALMWGKYMPGSTVPGTGDCYPTDIVLDASGHILLAGNFHDHVALGSNSLTSNSGSSDMFVIKADPQGDFVWGIQAQRLVSNPIYVTGLALDANNIGYVTGNIPFGGQGPQVMNSGNFNSYELGSFIYQLTTDNLMNRISGEIFYDVNLNGVKDSIEAYAPGIIVDASPSSLFSSSWLDGRYNTYVNPGTYTVSTPAAPLYYTAAPASYSLSFSGTGNSDTTRHFALQPMPGMQDLRVTLTATTVPRPGFDYPIHLTYKNIGTTTLSGNVELVLDSVLILQNTIPVQTILSGYTLTWAFTNLQPMQSASILVNTELPGTATLGNLFGLNATLLPLIGDLTPTDNVASIQDTIRGSYDPNDKQVSQNYLTPTEVAAGKYLEYTIRFQNTGTDTAFTVRLLDTLDTQLNIPTFEMLASSHPNTWSIKGNGILEWRFENILLPDSNTNEAASHGFVKYRIRPNTNLPLGSIIRNTAGIYFDFNAPVITNTATTEVALVSAVADVHKPQLQVYPNPNKGSFIVQLQNVQEQSVKAELRNVLGQVVWQQSLTAENDNVQQQVSTSGLSKGIYYLQVSTGKGTAVQKVVLE